MATPIDGTAYHGITNRNSPRVINTVQQDRKIDSEEKLIQYVRTMLGEPLITVDVTDSQIQLIIDEAFRKWSDYAFESMDRMIFTLPVFEDVQDYLLDDRVASINGVSFADGLANYISSSNGIWAGLPMMDQIPVNYVPYVNAEGQTSSLESMGSALGESATGVAGGVAGGPSTGGGKNDPGLAYAMLADSQTLQSIYSSTVEWEFNPSSHILRIFRQLSGLIMVEAALHYYPNPDFDDGFNTPWIKEYTIAKTKFLWGNNVGKFSQNLVGGAQINFDRLLSEAQQEIDRLEERLITQSPPLGVFSS